MTPASNDAEPSASEQDDRPPASPSILLSADRVAAVAGLLITVIAAVLWWVAAGFDEPDGTGIGPATFPRGICILLGVCGLIMSVQAGLRLARGTAAGEPLTIGRPLPVFAGIGLIAVYPALMGAIGYTIATALWMPAFLLVAGQRRPLSIALCTFGFLAFAKIVFDVILGVRLT